MHMLALVVIPPDGDVEKHLAALLDRWSEEYQDADGEWHRRDEGWYDWYQVGGRWTGVFDDGYNPETDPANLETCRVCGGSGKHPDHAPVLGSEPGTCNSCHGVGMKVAWPTQWVKHPGDVIPVAQALAWAKRQDDGDLCYTVVSGEKILHRRVFDWDETTQKGEFIETDGFDWKAIDILREADPTFRVVALDYHN